MDELIRIIYRTYTAQWMMLFLVSRGVNQNDCRNVSVVQIIKVDNYCHMLLFIYRYISFNLICDVSCKLGKILLCLE